jgi:hypothetical protein
MFIQLTDMQLAMLSAAAQREDRCLVAPPTLKGGAAQKVANKLIAAGLVTEIKAEAGDPIWRRDAGSGASYALRLTPAGAKEIAVDETGEPQQADTEDGLLKSAGELTALSKSRVIETAPAEAIAPTGAGPSAPRGGSKLMQVIELLQRNRGATIDELIAATGWLAHTTRAALTGLRKRGYAVAIDRSDEERGSFYRIPADPTGEDAALVGSPAEEPANSAAARKTAQRRSKPRLPRAA